jgi:thiosulfate dehydrogenase
MLRGIVAGALGVLVLLVVFGYAGIRMGMMPANADAKPMRLEEWAAKTSLHATLRREAPAAPNPLPLDDAGLTAGIKLYAQNCAVCHGAADGQPTPIARGLYQKPPQLAKHGVEDDPDGVTYWKVAHGIRFTGMPAFGESLSERQLWQLTLFLKHMDSLPAAPERVWKAVRVPT